MFVLPKQLINSSPRLGPYFPCLADEIAEPHPDMNIKVAAFTVREKFYYTCIDKKIQTCKYMVQTETKMASLPAGTLQNWLN